MFKATKRPYSLILSHAVEDLLSFSIFSLSSAGLMPLIIERFVPNKSAQTLWCSGRWIFDPPLQLIRRTHKSSRQSLFFTSCSTGLHVPHFHRILRIFSCALRSVHPGQFGCLLCAALLWLHMCVESFFLFCFFLLISGHRNFSFRRRIEFSVLRSSLTMAFVLLYVRTEESRM